MFGRYVRNFTLGGSDMCRRRKVLLTACLTICLILALVFTFGSFLSKAKNKEQKVTYYKYYTNIEIQPGDTLWDIGKRYYVPVSQLKEVNELPTEEISAGDKILVVKGGI